MIHPNGFENPLMEASLDANESYRDQPDVEDSREDEESQLLAEDAEELDDGTPTDDDDIIEEPDDTDLNAEKAEWENSAQEESLDFLSDPKLVVELSDDPVRLYLKEIGSIELLDPDREFCQPAGGYVDQAASDCPPRQLADSEHLPGNV